VVYEADVRFDEDSLGGRIREESCSFPDDHETDHEAPSVTPVEEGEDENNIGDSHLDPLIQPVQILA
jgi:hypothetical protein